MHAGRHTTKSMRRWLKRVTPDRQVLEKHWCLKHFTTLLLRSRLLDIQSIRRYARVRAGPVHRLHTSDPPAAGASGHLCAARRVLPAESAGVVHDRVRQQPVYLAAPGRRVDLGRRKALGLGLDAFPARHQSPILLDGFERALGAAAAGSLGARFDCGHRRLRAGAGRLARARHLPAARRRVRSSGRSISSGRSVALD